MRYEGRHERCGTVVADELPEGYPVDEGVGLWCPRCRESFWSRPEPEPAPNRRSLPMYGSNRPLDVPRHARWRWPAATAVALLAAAAAVTALLIGKDEPRPRPQTTPVATTTATPAPAAAPAPAPRDVTRGAVTATLPPGWHATRAGAHRVAFTGPHHARVTVSSAPRRGRTLHRLGIDTRAALHPEHHVALKPVAQGRSRALRVTAHGREVTALVIGHHRWIIARDVADGGRRVARSIRIRR